MKNLVFCYKYSIYRKKLPEQFRRNSQSFYISSCKEGEMLKKKKKKKLIEDIEAYKRERCVMKQEVGTNLCCLYCPNNKIGNLCWKK